MPYIQLSSQVIMIIFYNNSHIFFYLLLQVGVTGTTEDNQTNRYDMPYAIIIFSGGKSNEIKREEMALLLAAAEGC